MTANAKNTPGDPPVPNMRDIAGWTSQIAALSDTRKDLAVKRQKRIVELKEKFNVSYADMARATGLSEAAISKIAYSGGVPRREKKDT